MRLAIVVALVVAGILAADAQALTCSNLLVGTQANSAEVVYTNVLLDGVVTVPSAGSCFASGVPKDSGSTFATGSVTAVSCLVSGQSCTFNVLVALQGPTGPVGPTGNVGATGPTGPAGATGEPGTNGVDGEDGATGPTGPQGVTGPTGPKGDVGATGAPGVDGVNGENGPKGDKGETGPRGAEGPTGPQGEKGDPGLNGTNGQDGAPGATGPQGERGPQGEQGPKGDKGDTGSTGAAGKDGQDGATGATGPQGETGPTGPAGPAGRDGVDGTNGADGAAGAKGDTGAQGPKGDTGAQGPKGEQGPKGDTGAPGAPGADGAQGPAGPEGPKGDTGAQGPKGDTGVTGPAGPKGDAGYDLGLTQPTLQCPVGLPLWGRFDQCALAPYFQVTDGVAVMRHSSDDATGCSLHLREDAKVQQAVFFTRPYVTYRMTACARGNSGDCRAVLRDFNGASVASINFPTSSNPTAAPCSPCNGRVNLFVLKYLGAAVQVTITTRLRSTGALLETFSNVNPGDEIESYSPGDSFDSDVDIYIGTSTLAHTTIPVTCQTPLLINALYGDFHVVFGRRKTSSTSYGGLQQLCVGPPPCLPCSGPIRHMQLRYVANGNSKQLVTVVDKGNGATLFSSRIQPGNLITVVASNNNAFSGELEVRVAMSVNANIPITCNTRCTPGTVFGSFVIVDGSASNGGPLCHRNEERCQQYNQPRFNEVRCDDPEFSSEPFIANMYLYTLELSGSGCIVDNVCMTEDTSGTMAATVLASTVSVSGSSSATVATAGVASVVVGAAIVVGAAFFITKRRQRRVAAAQARVTELTSIDTQAAASPAQPMPLASVPADHAQQ